MENYKNLVARVLQEGERREDRTGTGTLSIFGGMLEFDLRERFPVVQAKETKWRTAFLEMLWFLRGEDNVHWLNANGSKLWDTWADDGGALGPVYGVQWRKAAGHFGSIDQVREVIGEINRNPHGRRHIVSAWAVADLSDMALPPCHWAHQLYASGDGWLDMTVQQRSWDLGLGAPFNIAQYALLLHLYARATGRKPRRLMFMFGDAHVYIDHIDGMKEMLGRQYEQDAARLAINTANTDIDSYSIDDFSLDLYEPQPFIPLSVSK